MSEGHKGTKMGSCYAFRTAINTVVGERQTETSWGLHITNILHRIYIISSILLQVKGQIYDFKCLYPNTLLNGHCSTNPPHQHTHTELTLRNHYNLEIIINVTFPSLFHVRKKPNSSTLKRQLGSKTEDSCWKKTKQVLFSVPRNAYKKWIGYLPISPL